MIGRNFIIGFCNFHVSLLLGLYFKNKGRPVFLSFTTTVSRNVWRHPASDAALRYK